MGKARLTLRGLPPPLEEADEFAIDGQLRRPDSTRIGAPEKTSAISFRAEMTAETNREVFSADQEASLLPNVKPVKFRNAVLIFDSGRRDHLGAYFTLGTPS